ncbi:ribosomal protein L11 methyltransferase [Oleiphilus messinensis]|uniref:Ribosomal protein L11 methyltransferase n=1 Tax=Oleiphilus messinensis TaxID=141451 RepID=A0A1Y0I6K8_9GAMM|nr:50S ribosomal protein L11 methyltransferase [Oleiphilus messinensis]ARU55064.1 ribosomal protein L11 methyltransferase [Oleiphilus messinensis]
MPWIQFVVRAEEKQAHRVEDLFLTLGACSVTFTDAEDQPVLEPAPGETPIWAQTQVTGLFDAGVNTTQITQALRSAYHKQTGQELAQVNVEILEDKDWEREWMENFHPIRCGERLWICPSWREPPEPDAVNLLLDPGLAFGTGTHPTTFLCLEWLDKQTLHQHKVVDFGCGSGILAISALLLGAESATGIDIDPQALLASRENATRNNLDPDRLKLYLPTELEPDNSVAGDIVIANILAQPLLQLADQISNMVKPGGKLALSGIIANQAEQIIARYQSDFDLDPVREKDDWVLISGTRR